MHTLHPSRRPLVIYCDLLLGESIGGPTGRRPRHASSPTRNKGLRAGELGELGAPNLRARVQQLRRSCCGAPVSNKQVHQRCLGARAPPPQLTIDCCWVLARPGKRARRRRRRQARRKCSRAAVVKMRASRPARPTLASPMGADERNRTLMALVSEPPAVARTTSGLC